MSAGELTLNIGSKCQGPCICSNKGNITASKDTSPESVRGFVSYVHSGKEQFTLKGTLDGGEKLGGGDDISGVKKVSVYYWDGDEDKKGRPLLIEVVRSDVENTEYYYNDKDYNEETQGNNRIWKYHGYSGEAPLQTRLDDCNASINNVVPFDIKDPLKELKFDSSASKGKGIEHVPSTPQLNGSNYKVTEYKITGSGTKLSRLEYDKQKLNVTIPPDTLHGIRLYSSPVNDNVPIAVELKSPGNGGSKWYYSEDDSGTNWGETGDGGHRLYGPDGKPTEALTKKLDGLACEHHNAVTMDLTKSNSDQYASDGNYCCEEHQKKGGKVSVTPVPVNCTQHQSQSSLKAYKHSISDDGLKLGGIKFYLNGDRSKQDRKRVQSTTLRLPAQGPVDVYVFYCSDNKPVLIYVQADEALPPITTWYRKEKNNDDKSWKKSNGKLKGLEPKNFNNLECKYWKKLKKVLHERSCSDLKDCSESPARNEEGASGDQEAEDEDLLGSDESSEDEQKTTQLSPQGAITLPGPKGDKGPDGNNGGDGGTVKDVSVENGKITSELSEYANLTDATNEAAETGKYGAKDREGSKTDARGSKAGSPSGSDGKPLQAPNYGESLRTQHITVLPDNSFDQVPNPKGEAIVDSKVESGLGQDGKSSLHPDTAPVGNQGGSGPGGGSGGRTQATSTISNSSPSWDLFGSGLGGLVARVVETAATLLKPAHTHGGFTSKSPQAPDGDPSPGASASGVSTARTPEEALLPDEAATNSQPTGESTHLPLTTTTHKYEGGQPPSETTAPEDAERPEHSAFTEVPALLGIGSIFGASSGTLTGAGATFFGGWKLYNRYKGDPWVRQI
ncbi:hypothetical protein BEWA_002180 [Theileria equi strain WA]|uniref:Uncharacterized protein n=1 Tax=Theileria equi strain WA TaxID=1537102 RepID=L0B0M0_THEEQ|nr:hypothetical protein BEWA_002180 [Theileria equi strain WA]AFZ80811.1 hypothetical protein BEWA_002180 [Theileria equi strain WA]|eukprot:XP_004830477.1 hypothetical protein BEWA_002180 [Theileria equi strain WA]